MGILTGGSKIIRTRQSRGEIKKESFVGKKLLLLERVKDEKNMDDIKSCNLTLSNFCLGRLRRAGIDMISLGR